MAEIGTVEADHASVAAEAVEAVTAKLHVGGLRVGAAEMPRDNTPMRKTFAACGFRVDGVRVVELPNGTKFDGLIYSHRVEDVADDVPAR